MQQQGRRTRATDRRYLLGFFVGAYVLAWLAFAVPILAVRGVLDLPAPQAVFFALATLGIAVAGVLAAAAQSGRAGVRALLLQVLRWRMAPLWYVAAVFGPAMLPVLGAALGVSLGNPPPAAVPLTTWLTFPVLFAGVCVPALLEEIGWRGFALPRLQHRFGWLTASLIVGVIWAGVHLPLWLIPDFGFAGQSVPLYFIQVTALSVMLAWLYNATGRSLLATTLAHAAANGWTILWDAALQGVPDQAPAIATQPLLTAATVGLALLVLFADRSRRAPTPSVARALLPVRPPTKQARGGDTSPLTDQPSG